MLSTLKRGLITLWPVFFGLSPTSWTREWKIRVTMTKRPWEIILPHLTGTTFPLSTFLDHLKSEVSSDSRKILYSSSIKYPYFYSSTSLSKLSPSYHFRALWCLPKSYPFFTQSLSGSTCFLLVPVHGMLFSFSTLSVSFVTNHLVLGIYFLTHTLPS